MIISTWEKWHYGDAKPKKEKKKKRRAWWKRNKEGVPKEAGE